MRAAIYARYSSDNQRKASIEDQVRLCRQRIENEDWTFVATYTDHAVSGASSLRPGYQKLLEDARAGAFDAVIAEGLDRLSRDQEDVAALYKHLNFAGVRLITLSEGEVNELHVGLKGTMNALYLKDLAQKTRRGLEGRVHQGRSGGGNSYGYDVVAAEEGHRGARRINEAEAAIVRRVFEEFAAGRSPRAIAMDLNKEDVTGPRGNTWGPSTIYGNWRRGTGLLNNELYVGKLVWNRQRFIKDPRTGRRQARPNPKGEWIIEDVPDLRIVDEALWATVKNRQKETRGKVTEDRGTRSERARRPAYLLSGLLKCARCGGGFSMISANHYGCSNARNRGTCDSRATIRRDTLEEAILTSLRQNLMEPDLVREFIDEYHRELNRARAAADADVIAKRNELSRVERGITRVIEAIKDGVPAAAIKEELITLEERKEALKAELAAAPQPVPRLHPKIAKMYREQVASLHDALNSEDTRTAAASVLRSLIQEIRLHPNEAGSLDIELVGDLAQILSLANKNPRRAGPTGVQVTLVAGAGFEPATFRL